MLSRTLDYAYRIDQITKEDIHPFNGITLLFVVDGHLNLKMNGKIKQLNKGDIFTINPNESYQLFETENNIIFSLSLHISYVLRYLPDFLSYTVDTYEANLGKGRKNILSVLQKSLAELGLMCDELKQHNDHQKLKEENTILHILQILERFFKFPKSITENQPVTNERIQVILNEINTHYSEKISLHELAEKEFISTSYLSRIFKKHLGISFTQYLQEIRLKHALSDLLHTNQPVEQIALNNGFSDVKTFRELMKQSYGAAPAAYRKKHLHPADPIASKEIRKSNGSPDITKIVSSLSLYSKQRMTEDIWEKSESEKILITPQEKAVPLPKSAKLLKIGQLSELLKKEIQDMIWQTNQEINFDYLVVQDFLTDEIILPEIQSDEHISTYIRYSDLDACLTFIQTIDKPLFIVLSPWKDNETEINREKLQLLFHHICFHFEDNLCHNWKIVYDYSNDCNRANLPIWEQQIKQIKTWYAPFHLDLSIGMSILTDTLTDDFEHHTNYAQFITKNCGLVDFYTCNIEPNQHLKENLMHQKYIQTDHAVKELIAAQQLLQKYKLAKPFYIMHWNTLTGNTRLTNGIFFRGALILKTSMTLEKLAAGSGVWLNTELFHRYDPFHHLIDGLELYNYEKLKRPAFFALSLKNRLQGVILANDEHYLLTKTKTGYQLLLLNPNYLNPFLSLEDWLVAKQRKEFSITIQALDTGFYQIKKFTFDYHNGAVYRQMANLSTVNGSDQEMLHYIREMTRPKLEVFDEYIQKTWNYYADLDINAVQLFEFKKIIPHPSSNTIE